MENEENVLAFKPSPIGIRLQDRLNELGISHSAANDAARSFARSIRKTIGQTYVRDVCIGRIQSPSYEKLDIIAAVFGISTNYLASGNGDRLHEHDHVVMSSTISQPSTAHVVGIADEIRREKDGDEIPRFSECCAGDMLSYGASEFDNQPYDGIVPPDDLRGKAGLVALLVTGESMLGSANHGSTIYATPKLPPVQNELVVIAMNDGARFVKIYEGKAGGFIKLRQLNPAEPITVPEGLVRQLYKVLAVYPK